VRNSGRNHQELKRINKNDYEECHCHHSTINITSQQNYCHSTGILIRADTTTTATTAATITTATTAATITTATTAATITTATTAATITTATTAATITTATTAATTTTATTLCLCVYIVVE